MNYTKFILGWALLNDPYGSDRPDNHKRLDGPKDMNEIDGPEKLNESIRPNDQVKNLIQLFRSKIDVDWIIKYPCPPLSLVLTDGC